MKKEDFAEQEIKFIEELSNCIRARQGILWVMTDDEARAKELIRVTTDETNRTLCTWISTKGLCSNGKAISQGPDLLVALQYVSSAKNDVRAIFVFIDLHTHLDRFSTTAPIVTRYLKDLSQSLPNTSSSIILLSPFFTMPHELEIVIKTLTLPLPTLEVFRKRLLPGLEQKGYIEATCEEKAELIKSVLGLTFSQAENAFAGIIGKKGKVTIKDIGKIMQEKKGIIRNTGLLEFIDLDNEDGEMQIGGMENLKEWLAKIKKSFSEEAKKTGVKVPKGVLLIGVPGCGKSWMVKVTAKTWNMLLLRLDPGRLYQKYVGDSEGNMRRVIEIVEALNPLVLWVDEIEKGFPKSSNETNGGTSERLLGHILTWMSEKDSPIFIMATCNNLGQLPPELTRKGRFDEIFFIDLPSPKEREEIFKIHLKKRGYTSDFNTQLLADESKGFTGAEIESAIDEALRDAFSDGVKLNPQHILNSLKQFTSLSEQRKEEIMSLRSWASGRARNASKQDIETQERQTRWDTLENGDEKNAQDK